MKKFLALILLMLIVNACALKPALSTIDQIAKTLCVDFFSQQPKTAKLSPTEIEQALCATEADLAPFINATKTAESKAGAARLAPESP